MGEPVKVEVDDVVIVPKPRRQWHYIARMWYESLGKSGQAVFYTTSDWCVAYSAAELLSREMLPKQLTATGPPVEAPISAAAMMSFLKANTMLLATEGDRRRAAIELQRKKPSEDEGDVTWIDDARSRLHGGTAS